MEWIAFDNGVSIGQTGSEDGVILRDDEHPIGARITLEKGSTHAPFSVTCGIYGWMFHTRFIGSEQEAEYEQMKDGLADILNMIPLETDPESDKKTRQVSDAISKFCDRYP